MRSAAIVLLAAGALLPFRRRARRGRGAVLGERDLGHRAAGGRPTPGWRQTRRSAASPEERRLPRARGTF